MMRLERSLRIIKGCLVFCKGADWIKFLSKSCQLLKVRDQSLSGPIKTFQRTLYFFGWQHKQKCNIKSISCQPKVVKTSPCFSFTTRTTSFKGDKCWEWQGADSLSLTSTSWSCPCCCWCCSPPCPWSWSSLCSPPSPQTPRALCPPSAASPC